MTTDKTKKIAELNDLFRKGISPGLGKVFCTQGISRLPALDQMLVMQQVTTFCDLTEDNDPHGEHDFGAFEVGGRKVFWKIDYYDSSMTGGSAEPSDPAQTIRVLTTMLASEY